MTIKILLWNNDELLLDVLPTDTVGNLKKQIESHRNGMPIGMKKLMLGNAELTDDDKTLEDSGISNDMILEIKDPITKHEGKYLIFPQSILADI